MTKEELEIIFTYHPPGNNVPRFEAVRNAQRELANIIIEQSGPGEERDQALLKLQEAGFWANAAIAREAGRKKLKHSVKSGEEKGERAA